MENKVANTITGSRISDLVVFGILLAVLVISSPRLRVYYKSTPTDVFVLAVYADASRKILPTPEQFTGPQPGIFWTERKIQEFSKTQAAIDLTPPGGKLEWSLEHGINTPPFFATRTLITNTLNE